MMRFRGQARVITEELREAQEQASLNGWKPKCKGNPGPYMDYDIPPSGEEAETLCAGCPILDLCYSYALATKQPIGVWGGVVFDKGVPRVTRKRAA